MLWFYNRSGTKSYADVDKLIHDVIRHDDFEASDFSGSFSTAREADHMDENQSSKPSSKKSDDSASLPFKPIDGWIQASVSIPVPCDGFIFSSEEDVPHFVVDGIWYRQPLKVIKQGIFRACCGKFSYYTFQRVLEPIN